MSTSEVFRFRGCLGPNLSELCQVYFGGVGCWGLRGLCKMWLVQTSQKDLLWRAKVAIWQTATYHFRSYLATCQLQHFCGRHLPVCDWHLQPPLRTQQSPWGAQKSWQAFQRIESKMGLLGLKSKLPPVDHAFHD